MELPYKLGFVLVVFNIYTTYLRREPDPVDVRNILREGGKYVVLSQEQPKSDRILEYFTYGSQDKNSPVIVEFNGFGGTAKRLKEVGDEDYKKLGLKGIGITIPGFGYSTLHEGHRVKNWPLDVEQVLEKENVTRFILKGQSFGSGHAMSVAHYFKDHEIFKCVGMILLVPLISPIHQDQIGVAHSARNLGRIIHFPWISDLAFFFLAGSTLQQFSPNVRKMAAEGFNVTIFLSDLERGRRHTHLGWKSNLETMISEHDWGFHPSDIRLSRVSVMYASDDNINPPEYGEWLAKQITNSFEVVASGYNHLTFQKMKHLVVEEIKEHIKLI